MATTDVIDIEKLLRPIAEDAPTGEDLRQDPSPSSAYYQIREARTRAAREERAADEAEDPNFDAAGSWAPVREQAEVLLAEKTKDLEVGAWLTEALLRCHGYAGLRDGFRLIRGLVEQHWQSIYPTPDEEGMATRVWPLNGLNGIDGDGALIAPIRKVPITEGRDADPLASWQYEQASKLEALPPEERAARAERGAISMEMFNAEVGATSKEFFRDLLDDVTACAEEFDGLTKLLDETCGSDSPHSSNIRNALRECVGTVTLITRDILVEPEGETTEGGGAEGEAGPAETGPVANREAALRTLLQVAEFFRRTEPHSPVSYALEQAVRWGRMPLPDLWAELISEKGSRENVFRLTGIPTDDGS